MIARIITSAIDAGTRWQAWDRDMGTHASPIGNGPTEAAAIADLTEMLSAMEAAK